MWARPWERGESRRLLSLARGRQELRSSPFLGLGGEGGIAPEGTPAGLPPSSSPWAPHPGPSWPHSIGRAQAAAPALQAAPGDAGLQGGAGHPQVPVQRPVGGRVPKADGQPPYQSPGVLRAPRPSFPTANCRWSLILRGRRRAPRGRVQQAGHHWWGGRGEGGVGVAGCPEPIGKSQVS